MSPKALGWKHATGILLRADRIVVTQASGTPLGVRQVTSRDELIGEDGLAAALQRVAQTGGLRGKVVCGVDPRLAYSVTTRSSPEDASRTVSELLCGRLGLPSDALVTGVEMVKLPSGMHQVIAASPRPMVARLYDTLKQLGRPEAQLVSVPWLLYHKGTDLKSRPRKWRCDVRVFAGEEGSLAVLAWAGQPIASQMFEMPAPDDADAVALAVMALDTLAREELGIPGVDGVVLHLGSLAEPATALFEACCALPILVAPQLTADPSSVGAVLAGVGIRTRVPPVDQFMELHPPFGLRQNFPRRAAAVLALGFGGLGWTLHSQCAELEHTASRLEQTAAANAKRIHVEVKDIPKLHEKLGDEVSLADNFLVQRVRWSEVLRETPAVIPPTMTVLDFDGSDPLHFSAIGKKRKKAKSTIVKGRQLLLSGQVPLEAEDPSPPEVAELTASVHASSVFASFFPRVDGANVRLLPVISGLAARISVVCLPEGH